MKFYESHYEEYIHAVKANNLHPELLPIVAAFPSNIRDLENIIFYGPAGVGKYSQVLNIIHNYSMSHLKYDKKITAQTDKLQYIYRISDIHYEVDMSLLGCNAKFVWHEVFFQIIDIISVKSDKFGIIVCKNFHLIHSELLEIFYSYIQQYNHSHTNIRVKFFIITEHISFIPFNILNTSHIFKIARPSKALYKAILNTPNCISNSIMQSENDSASTFIHRLTNTHPQDEEEDDKVQLLDDIDTDGIINIKETRSFALIKTTDQIPKDIFNIICDNIITSIITHDEMSFTGFRDTLYDILTYNLDVPECLWYILRHFIQHQFLKESDVADTLTKTATFLKYYNNNYRPIYHLESIMFYIINKIRA